jgi:hypothetical protein
MNNCQCLEKDIASICSTEDGGSRFFETVVTTYQAIQYHIPDDHSLNTMNIHGPGNKHGREIKSLQEASVSSVLLNALVFTAIRTLYRHNLSSKYWFDTHHAECTQKACHS